MKYFCVHVSWQSGGSAIIGTYHYRKHAADAARRYEDYAPKNHGLLYGGKDIPFEAPAVTVIESDQHMGPWS